MLKSHFKIQPDDVEEEWDKELEHPEEQKEVVEEETREREALDVRRLEKSEISVRLSFLGKTADASGYAYLKAECTDLRLTEISNIRCFTYLQYVDFSNNQLTIDALQPVTDLPYIVLVQADNNPPLTSAALNRTKYMQVIIMTHNSLKTVDNVYQPELSTLDVGYNQISKVNFLNRMPNIRVLDFRYNLLKDIDNFNFPNLDSLYLAGNKISRLEGLASMPNLRVLHVRNNPLKHLDGFDPILEKLEYINLRNCRIRTLKQVRKLKVLPALSTLVMKGCPYMGGSGTEEPDAAQEEEDSETRVEVLATLQHLKRLNKAEFTDDERQEAKDLMTLWLEEGEKEEDEEVDEEGLLEEADVEG